MGLNDTPNGERKHIAFFGCRNAGKSSLLNAVTGQQMAIVSDVKGTTTDPVSKAMELLPAGPVLVTDTPGLDDEGELGRLRIQKALGVLRSTDVAVVVIDGAAGLRAEDGIILDKVRERNVPYIVALNKIDMMGGTGASVARAGEGATDAAGEGPATPDPASFQLPGIDSGSLCPVSALTGEGIRELKERIAALARDGETERPLASDLACPLDMVVLVVPIDKAAPKGRLILPQQQVIRDLLDHGAVPVITRDTELPEVLTGLGSRVRLVITDSQAFAKVAPLVPEDIPLTSFSILFARYKGELEVQRQGLEALGRLQDGDKVLIAEGCTHHRQCGDIGTEKIPKMVRRLCGHEPVFETVSGVEFPEDPSAYRVIIHCGGCMLNEREMKARIGIAESTGVPITNYGMTIALATGILERSIASIEVARRRAAKARS